MGAWGLLFDENDDAADWLAEFGDSPQWSIVDQALELRDDEYLEAPECSNALAAAEVVAAALGKASPRLEPEIVAWARHTPEEAELRRAKARAALIRVRDDSELGELWQDSDEHADWQSSVNETLSRL